MKILIPISLTNSPSENPFVRVLRDGLASCGHEVVCSSDLFWTSPINYDLLFFQWPEGILNRHRNGPELSTIANRIDVIKQTGVTICITCHNLFPHGKNSFVSEVYDYIYSQADAFHHMGIFSCNYLKQKYPNAFHFVAPHPIFYDVDTLGLTQGECKRKYNINKDKVTLISFGAFRDEYEHKLILDLKKTVSDKLIFWAPKFYTNSIQNNNKLSKIIVYSFNYLKYKTSGIKMNFKIINDNEVLSMVNAADILLIQRKDILNSGNLPLGFSAKKIVVGPNVGNVGEILKMTGNPVFDPNDKMSIKNAVEQAVQMFYDSNKQGLSNYQFAKKHWIQQRVAETINESLKKMCKA